MTEPIIEGGRRERFIRQSLWQLAEDTLTALGWLGLTVENGGTRRHKPVTLIKKPQPVSEQVTPNAIGLTLFGTEHEPREVGSEATVDSYPFSFDIFAENDPVGREIAGDLRSALAGQFSGIDRTEPTLDVYDWATATPQLLFQCMIERVSRDQAHGFTDHRRFWFTVEGTIEDDPPWS